ncbi:hypothetical protein D3C72_1312760 [compost metagenome]
MDGVATKIAEKIPVFLDNDDIDTAAREQQAKHHARRPAAGHGDGRADTLNGPAVIFRSVCRLFHHLPPMSR